MKTKISLLLITCLCSLACLAQSDFDKHFTKKSLRIDFALSGNSQFQAAAIQQLREEPVWGGPVKNLIAIAAVDVCDNGRQKPQRYCGSRR